MRDAARRSDEVDPGGEPFKAFGRSQPQALLDQAAVVLVDVLDLTPNGGLDGFLGRGLAAHIEKSTLPFTLPARAPSP